MDSSVNPSDIGFAGALNVVRAYREICGFQCFGDIGVGKPVGCQFGCVRLNHILLIVAAKRIDIGDA